MLYLKNLYPNVPFVGYFELLPPPFWSDSLALRPDFPPPETVRLFNATYHSLTYLHLHAVDACYTPTNYQLGLAPQELRHKVRVIFDGLNTDFFQRRPIARPANFRGLSISAETRVVTYVSRGLEAIRGFDIFMRAAKRIYQAMPNTLFLVAGEERSNYGHEGHHIGKQSFKQYVLSQDEYDLSKIHFLGRIPVEELATLYNLSDLHIYLTVPYVLSWSLLQAMASECAIVSSSTEPVTEVIEHGVHGMLSGFYDVDGLVEHALAILGDPQAHRHLSANARQRVVERYENSKCVEQLVTFFEGLSRPGSRT
jgi:glycosyltransferase involved in cell wall biosynthesis